MTCRLGGRRGLLAASIATVVWLSLPRAAGAEGQTPPPQTTPPPAQTSTPPASSDPAAASGQAPQTPPPAGRSNQRLFGVLPNNLTVDKADNVAPLTAGQKFSGVAQSAFDWVELPWTAMMAGISQANHSDSGYGYGATGYGKRYASAYADNVVENFSVGAVFPSLLGEDPRYFRMGHGSFLSRAGYSVTRVFVARTDAGHARVNLSEIFGAVLAGSVSNLYQPKADRSARNVAGTARTLVTYDALANVMKEFWPDVSRHLFHHSQSPAPAAGPSR